MLARIQQLLTLVLVAVPVAWALYFWQSSPALAAFGFIVLVLGYTAVLALEFVLLWRVNRIDPAPQATFSELVSAWWGESLIAPKVFCWRQPFRANALPDNLAPEGIVPGKRGVVFIHGFFCNRGFWNPWLQWLRGSGHAYVAVSLEPVFGSIDEYTPLVDAAVRQVTDATGLAPLLVCHSMGGLAARAWLKSMKAELRVHHVVTIGSPHGGTWLARFGHGKNGQQMRLASSWLNALNIDMPADRAAPPSPAILNTPFTCWYSNADNIVFPTSSATLPGADNRLIRGQAHVQMAFAPQVVDQTLSMLVASTAAKGN